MKSRGLIRGSLLFARCVRDVKRMRGRIRIILLVGTAVFMLWSSPTTAAPSLPASPTFVIGPITLPLVNNSANGVVFGGQATGTGGFGAIGYASDTSSQNFGVAGATNSNTGTGVFGLALATVCPTVVPPVSLGQTCVGVVGQSSAIVGTTAGVSGITKSPTGAGVFGQSLATFGTTAGVSGITQSPFGAGVFGQSLATNGPSAGVSGNAQSPFGVGVFGESLATSGTGTGVAGTTHSPLGNGVVGESLATSGLTAGVSGINHSPNGNGVVGESFATFGPTAGVSGITHSPNGNGVFGQSLATSGPAAGVSGITQSSNGAGVVGRATSSGGAGIVGVGTVSGALAGNFLGPVTIRCSPAPCLFVNGTPIADLAEDMPVARPVSPGDVVVLARGQGYGIAPAARAYDSQVAGIVSTAPRVRFGIGREQAVPVAMVGVVKAKASAVNGAIEFGDLLTTSPVAGHLMRCEAALRCVGAIVGKALEPLSIGEHTILVLLWRQ